MRKWIKHYIAVRRAERRMRDLADAGASAFKSGSSITANPHSQTSVVNAYYWQFGYKFAELVHKYEEGVY